MKTLSPRQLGLVIGVSESSIKRWVDDGQLHAERTAGGHRRIRVVEAVRFVHASGLTMVKPQALGLTELDDSTRRSGPARGDESEAAGRRLREALVEGRAAEVRAFVLGGYAGPSSVAAMCDGPLGATMGHVRTLRRHGRAAAYVEHRATDLAIGAGCTRLRGLLPTAADDAPLAVGAAPEADAEALPTLMAAVTLAAAGWRAVNLGHHVPLPTLHDAADRLDAQLVWLATSVDRGAERTVTEAAQLAGLLAPRRRTLAVGGRAWPRRVRLKATNLHPVDSMAALHRLADRLRDPAGPPIDIHVRPAGVAVDHNAA